MINIDVKQVVAGALLKFGYIKERDINLFAYELEKNRTINVNNEELNDLYKYVTGNYERLDENSQLDFSKLVTYNGKNITLTDYLNELQGNVVKDFFDNMTLEELVLRKVSAYSMPYDDRTFYFGKEELDEVEELIDNYSLVLCWNDGILYDDYQEIKLTHIGKESLFKMDNKERLEIFRENLESNGYDSQLIDDFLRVQNLEQPVTNILNIVNFKYFCNTYDRCPIKEENSKVLVKKNSK